MTRVAAILAVLLLALGAVNSASPALQATPHVQIDELTLRVVDCATGTLPNVTGDAGTQVCMAVRASGTTSLQFKLLYDPAVLGLAGLAQGQIPEGWLFAPNTTQPGVVSIAVVGLVADGVEGFEIVQITFDLIGSPGQCSDLIFTDALAGDSSIPPQSIPVTPVNGSICIQGDIPPGACTPPILGNWVVTESCTFEGTATAPANVIVEENISLTIAQNAALDIDFSNFHLLIKNGGKVVIKDGGKIH